MPKPFVSAAASLYGSEVNMIAAARIKDIIFWDILEAFNFLHDNTSHLRNFQILIK